MQRRIIATQKNAPEANAPDASSTPWMLAEALGHLAFEAALVPAIHEVSVK
jgi:hypothetical protein